MTAIVLAAVLTTAPTLPVSDGIDRTAETRGVLLEQIIAHQEYTEHMHDVWRHRRREAARAAEEVVTTTVEPAPVTTYYPAGALTAEQVASYLRGAGFPEWAIPTMVGYAYRESRFNPGAINSSSGACGLWQLYPCPGPDALDPARNAALAYQKFAASGFSPWGG